MEEAFSWCVIVNRLTCKSRVWMKWEALLVTHDIPHSIHHTISLDRLSDELGTLLALERKHFLFVGGDGTLHHGGNLLIQLAKEKSNDLVIGVLPCGTGNDWVRTFGIPKSKIFESLKLRLCVPLPILHLQWPDGRDRYAFNMVGGALDAAVVSSLNSSNSRFSGALKYPVALLKSLAKPHKWNGTIIADNKKYTGDWLTIQAGFGKYCGGGMYVLPHGTENKAALLLMRPKSIWKLITSLPKLYNGKISNQKEAIESHFSTLEINHNDLPIPIEADGEWLGTSPITIQAVYGRINRLVAD